MDWKKEKVLVTGAGGFIGSHLTEELVKLGADVTAMVKNNSRHNCGFIEEFEPEVKDKIKIFFGDLNDIESVKNIVGENKVIFHLGAEISVPYSYVHPRSFVQTNIIGTLNILLACKENRIKNLILMSTSEVYGMPDTVPINEKHLLKGQSPYSATKIAAEKLAESFYSSYDLPVVIVRVFNTYGPRQSARAVIPTIITQALAGNKISVGNCETTRDFNYVTDIVNGLIKVAECPNVIGEVINIGSGKEISIKDLIEKIISLTESDCEIVQESERIRSSKSEVMRLMANNSKMKQLTGWQSKVSLDDGLKETINWIKNNIEIYKVGEYKI